MRIAVSDVLECLTSGMTEDQILSDFPELASEDIRECLPFAADREKRSAGSNALNTPRIKVSPLSGNRFSLLPSAKSRGFASVGS